jgi:hypothetical protein
MHLGLVRTPGFVDLPPVEFIAALKEKAPETRTEVLRPGEGVDLD